MMHPRVRNRLIALNVVLLAILAMVSFGPIVTAQPDRSGSRAPGDYTMVSGRVQGSTADFVYILDGANRELVSLRWDRTKQQLMGVGYRNLRRDAGASNIQR